MKSVGPIYCRKLVAFVLLLLGGSLLTVGIITADVKTGMEDASLRISIINSSTATSKSIQCQRLWSASIQNFMTCCNMPTRNTVKCLPSFIIAGVQKGGTTALSALLCTVEIISFSKKKEVHFFDNSRHYSGGITEYLKQFYEWDYAPTKGLNPPVFGESTPFYIASRDACRRISETVPDVKMIVLLREPVRRAHSEYEMKKRSHLIPHNVRH
jgi:Sulfotransferase domain